ncbi:FAD-dependent thymidylate synthase [candidate division WOR-3 bacterium]|nr:FAD-dependent thymidylate synthase [candidate division WOR-3 bacterium]
MKVILAGYNIDTEVIEELKKQARKDITPETISAAYARISRDPRPVNKLRKIACREVEKARKSNKNIIFNMGHHSIAEHAVFNFDIIEVSRLAIEEIEKFRLSSYTEKSQRYITLSDDFIISDEIKNSKYDKLFINTIHSQNKFYHKLYNKLRDYLSKKYPDKSKQDIDNLSKEDARYIIALATSGQLGETVNARNLELMIRRFASCELSEIRELGKKMHGLVAEIAPSIILFFKANDYDKKTYKELEEFSNKLLKDYESIEDTSTVQLVDFTPNADDITTAVILHSSSKMSFNECLKFVKELTFEKKKEVIKKACQYMELYDTVLREFEYVNLTYNLVVSATCFAQLKRHRMASITCQRYDPEFGITIPESIKEIKMIKEFNDLIDKTNEVYYKLTSISPTVAQYILTNAHRKRVLLRVNARELYHISRLREDTAAQWDIQKLTNKMVKSAQNVMPLTLLFIGGKDNYPKVYKEIFGKLPKVTKIILPS